MEGGSSSEVQERGNARKGQKLGSVFARLEPFIPRKGHDPRELRSWAKRTGFVSDFSGESHASLSQRTQRGNNDSSELDLERGLEKHGSSSPKIEIDPVLGRTRNRGIEIEPVWGTGRGAGRNGNGGDLGIKDGRVRGENQRRNGAEFGLGNRDEEGRFGLNGNGDGGQRVPAVSQAAEPINRGIEIEPILGTGRRAGRNGNGGDLGFKDGRVRGENQRRNGAEFGLGVRDEEGRVGLNGNGNGTGVVNSAGQRVPAVSPAAEPMKDDRNVDSEEGIDDVYQDGGEPGPGGGSSGMKLGLRDNPGVVPLMYYGLQHYLSLAGSLIFIPLVIVPAMGGTDKDTATVISTMLLVSGITTILHLYFGTRLPLVQGSSFVYLAPALIIANSEEIRNLTEHKFRHVMRELQGAIIIGSIFQSFLGFSGLMSFLVRLVNPVVVAPTVAAVGLAFFSYGFPQAGSCVEISLPQILLVLIFTLYLRGISVFGHRIFRIYAVPLSAILIWTYAFFLTAGGAYNYKGCSPDIPSSNILIDACRRHAYTMKHCRTDASNAWRTAAWVRVPYPLQWGIPIFHLRTSLMMIVVSLVASVDSVGTYHTTSVRINSKPPTPGVVSRGIGMEGFCSTLAALWGTGTGSTTLTENVHTINVTKVASRKAVEIGAVLLIFCSFIGKVGAILASIPQALAAGILCFIWALTVALGLSTLHYCQTGSFRNMTIVGVSLFLGLSVPAYFQQYQPDSSLILPGYFVPFATASHGPFHSGSVQFDFAVNGLLSLNMVITLLVALLLDNTVPGSRQERGMYIWSGPEDTIMDPSALSDYSLPEKVAQFFHRSKCLC